MKLKFKVQPFQTNAVESVVDCFAGQSNSSGITYRIDPGRAKADHSGARQAIAYEETGYKNSDLVLTDTQLINNIHVVQRRQNLPLSNELITSAGCKVNLDIEMETGTGKTYCYIKSIFEMNKRYGWSKFIVVVPSIAIREGVFKSLEITAEHFNESYGKKSVFLFTTPKTFPRWKATLPMQALMSWSSISRRLMQPGKTIAVSMMSWMIFSHAAQSMLLAATDPS